MKAVPGNAAHGFFTSLFYLRFRPETAVFSLWRDMGGPLCHFHAC
jgi:hypothetical protein